MFNAKNVIAATGLLAAAVVNGHLVITSPQPHDFILNDATSKGRPLDAGGSEFPCRNSGLLDYTGPVNSYALGSKQSLALQGTAVHGGGSCQLSITYDTAPTKDSVFKVIHTIQNGCPARDAAGNIGDDADAADPYTYDYTIPSDIPAGNATIAWSWINRVGNREFYMNCGVLELTGTGGDQANFDSLPTLFVANQPGSDGGCVSDGAEPMDITIPNPGDSVETNDAISSLTTYNSATCKSASAATGGSGSGATSAVATATSAAVSTSAATISATGGVFITKTTTAATTAVPAASTTLVTTAITIATSSAAAASTSAATGSGSSGSVKTGACTTEGMYSCTGTSFQQCASGTWSTVMQMAAGTECTPGESTDMTITASGRRRARRALKN